MSSLHAYFAQRNQHVFQRTLEAGRSHSSTSNGSNGPSTSGGKSWTRPSGLNIGMPAMQPDINARDWLGRTVLHLACAATDSAAVEYVRMILGHPGVNVNLQDRESMWTALHRALYHGNLATAILLLKRTDTDTSLKDLEGYTAFDLYNSTVEHTKPSDSVLSRTHLFTWGTNRNATLCLGDDKDRVYPDQVQLRPSEHSQESKNLTARLLPLPIREIAMSKLHTVVLTEEHRHNVRVCGFGSGGRLGAIQHTQYSLTTVPGYGGETVVATALGQDHTLILTKTGEVYSWGLNRFSQLGYLVETPTTGAGKPEEPVQTTPKKVPTPKTVIVRGIAVSKIASACWSAEHLYTWGTNNGQLGYDKAAQPIQISPRVVTKVQKPVIMVAMAENAMACLLETHEVLCFANDRQTKINFPVETFPSEITPYRPPQSVAITKITVSEGIFAALSTKGEVFTFSIPTFAGATPTTAISDTAVKPVVIRPQRVWSLRKKFSAATDLALGTDGALAVCTESGHVYVAARGLKGTFSASAKGSKFIRMPGLQRVTRISANSTGGFGALHAEYRPSPIDLEGNTIPEDFATVRPWLKEPDDHGLGKSRGSEPASKDGPAAKVDDDDDDDEGEDERILNDIRLIKQLCTILRQDKECRALSPGRGTFTDTRLGYGADIMVQVGSAFEFPAHRLVLAVRSPILRDILSGGRLKKDSESKINLAYRPGVKAGVPRLAIDGCRPMAALLIMTYLYTDDIPAVWDRRVLLAVEVDLVALGVRTADVKRDLRHLARILELPRLDEALEPLVKRTPVSSLLRDVRALHANVGSLSANSMPQPDVALKLADGQVQAYSLVLRARSPLFAAFFDTEDWTRQRWSGEGTIEVDFSHLKSRPMDFVMRFICLGEEETMFEQLDFIKSVDELIDFLFDVIAAANELHLGRLILVCSRVMAQYINIYNIGYMLSDASYFHTFSLISRLHAYMAINMETLLEGGLLDNLSAEVVKQLSIYVRSCQATKSPVARSNKIVDNAMLWWGDWLALQDIPVPIVPSARGFALRDNPRLSPPVMMTKRTSMEQVHSRRPHLPASVVSGVATEDDVFAMDDSTEANQNSKAVPAEPPTTPSKKTAGTWKIGPSTPRADLKSIMAEAKVPRESSSSTSSPRALPPRQLNQTNWRAGPSPGDASTRATQPVQRVNSGGLPWKAPDIAATSTSGHSGTPGSPSPIPRTRIEAYPALGSAPPRPLGSPAKATTPGMGPTIAPTRQASSSRVEGKRSTSTSGKVWSSPAPQPSVEPMSMASGLSFADIQAIQIAQAQPVEKDKRSLLEIQQEERARQEETDFLRWWAEEEARTKAEMDGAATITNPSESKKRRSRKPKEPKNAPASASDSPGASNNPSIKNVDRPTQPRKPSRADQPTNGAPSGSQSTTNPAGINGSGPSRRGGPRHRGAPHNGHEPRTAPHAQAI